MKGRLPHAKPCLNNSLIILSSETRILCRGILPGLPYQSRKSERLEALSQTSTILGTYYVGCQRSIIQSRSYITLSEVTLTQSRMSFQVKKPGRRESRLLLRRPRIVVMHQLQGNVPVIRTQIRSYLPRVGGARKRVIFYQSIKLQHLKHLLRKNLLREDSHNPQLIRVVKAMAIATAMASNTTTCCTDQVELVLPPKGTIRSNIVLKCQQSTLRI